MSRRLLIAGLLLLVGGAITLTLYVASVPESLLDFLYDTLLSGLEVAPHPSQTATDIVRYVSLAGGLAELAAGLALLAIFLMKTRA